MKYKCESCSAISKIPDDQNGSDFLCHNCQKRLPSNPIPIENGEASAAVGLIGGAALGASIGGPVGAVIGGIVGAVLGKNAKGLG